MIAAYKQPHNEMHEWIKRRTREIKPSALIPVVDAEVALNKTIIVTKRTITSSNWIVKLAMHNLDFGATVVESQRTKEKSVFVGNRLSHFLIFNFFNF
jgi:hypothetical protein